MFLFNHVALNLANRTLDLTSGTFHAHLVTADPNGTDTQVTHLVRATGGNYAPVALANRQILEIVPGVMGLDFDDPTWAAPTNDNTPILGWVVAKGTTAASPLVAYLDFSEPLYLNGAPLTLTIPEGGVLKLDVRGAA